MFTTSTGGLTSTSGTYTSPNTTTATYIYTLATGDNQDLDINFKGNSNWSKAKTLKRTAKLIEFAEELGFKVTQVDLDIEPKN